MPGLFLSVFHLCSHWVLKIQEDGLVQAPFPVSGRARIRTCLSPESLLQTTVWTTVTYLVHPCFRNLPLLLARAEAILIANEEMGNTNQKTSYCKGMWMRIHGSAFCCLYSVGSFRAELSLLQLHYLFIWKITPYVWSASGLGHQMVVFKNFFSLGRCFTRNSHKGSMSPISMAQIQLPHSALL